MYRTRMDESCALPCLSLVFAADTLRQPRIAGERSFDDSTTFTGYVRDNRNVDAASTCELLLGIAWLATVGGRGSSSG